MKPYSLSRLTSMLKPNEKSKRSSPRAAAGLAVLTLVAGAVTGRYVGAPHAAFAQSAGQPTAQPSTQTQPTAQSAAQPGGQTAVPALQAKATASPGDLGCTPGPGKLGVSRVVEIDTTRGPRFGLQQYHEHDFLRENEIVLTFDDGPLRRNSRMVLDALAAHCTRATFFMVGQMAVSDPEMARDIAAGGHTIAIHTWSHKNLHSIGAAKAQTEIELGISAVQRSIGQPVAPFFRFPYLADSPAMITHLGQRNFGVFSIDADSSDYRTKNPVEMQRNIFKALGNTHKGILLFHDIQFSTAHGIQAVLDRLSKEGYRVVHLVPKVPAVTDPRYDALADAELARRHKVATTNPMATRSVVWPLSAPAGVPTEQYSPEVATAPVGGHPAAAKPAAAAPASAPRPRATPAAAPSPAPAAAPTAPAANPTPAAAGSDAKPAMRGTAEDEDWRRRVFQNN